MPIVDEVVAMAHAGLWAMDNPYIVSLMPLPLQAECGVSSPHPSIIDDMEQALSLCIDRLNGGALARDVVPEIRRLQAKVRGCQFRLTTGIDLPTEDRIPG